MRRNTRSKAGTSQRPNPEQVLATSERSAEEEYKLGPGHPPKEYRFKPGQSGNPKGAKRKQPSLLPDLRRLFEAAFNQKAKVTQGDRERLITMWGAGMRQLAVQFAKGDRHARRDTFWIAEQLGSDFLKPEKTAEVGLSPDYQAILDAYVARTARPAGSHRRAGVGAITGFY